MKLPPLKIILKRTKGPPWEARVAQSSANGELFGENLLKGHRIMVEKSARDIIECNLKQLSGGSLDITYEVHEPKLES